MAEGLTRTAIETLKTKYIPSTPETSVFVPAEEYRNLFDTLEIWDKETADPDIQDKAKFIYDTLKEVGNPKEQIVSLITTLGITPQGDTKLNRVYRYLKLQKEAIKVNKYHETLTNEMKAIQGGR
jgi:hypothetical protein